MSADTLSIAIQPFPNYTQLKSFLPRSIWDILQEFASLLRPFKRMFRAAKAVPAAAAGKPAASGAGPAELRIMPDGKTSPLRPGQSLLDAIEACGSPIDAGCRSGLCGADPIAVTAGMDHLSPIGDDERATLQRLGCAENTRLACSARLRSAGTVNIELKPHKAGQIAARAEVAERAPLSPELAAIRRVVIIGNGIAGLTAAEHLRRGHPECEIHLIGRERHGVYNRMGIARLITAPSGMKGMHLLPESWYEEHADDGLLPLDEARRRFDHNYLVRLMRISRGNVSQAARLAQRNRTDFYKLLQRHDLNPGEFKSDDSAS